MGTSIYTATNSGGIHQCRRTQSIRVHAKLYSKCQIEEANNTYLYPAIVVSRLNSSEGIELKAVMEVLSRCLAGP